MSAWTSIREWFGFHGASSPAQSYELASPWGSSNAQQLVWAEHFQVAEDTLVTRQSALQVPAIARARALLVGAIADLPLVAYRGDERLSRQPSWCYRTSGALSPWHRMAATIDDHLMHGVSAWVRVNGADGFPIDFARIPPSRWTVDQYGQIIVDGKPAPADEVTVIPGPGEGILATAAGTIRGARAIEKAWQSRVRTPIPPTLFEQTDKETATPDEIQRLLSTWGKYRQNPDSAATAFVPYGISAKFPAANDDSQLFVEGRNAIRLDVANHTNISASLLDGSTAAASLTYRTATGERSNFYTETIPYWTRPIAARLSMDDIVPKGQRVAFDFTQLENPQPPDGGVEEAD